MKRYRRRALCLLLAAALLLGGCAGPTAGKDDGRLRVVCTLFPYYDFVRAIGGDRVEPYLLVTAGREAHSFEPTPLDVIRISEADVFLCNGGESEEWVEDILSAAGENIGSVVRMMDHVDALGEEFSEGMQGGHDDHDGHDHDGHEEHIEYAHDLDAVTALLAGHGFTDIRTRPDGPMAGADRAFIEAVRGE